MLLTEAPAASIIVLVLILAKLSNAAANPSEQQAVPSALLCDKTTLVDAVDL
ncbi:MAG: hypothetical protein P3M73_00205 [Candidatus Hodgkinia cicadicola]|nr:MAG: hypothetical protein P3M73_00205 [Candidatus Hodgkinia cicadicola]